MKPHKTVLIAGVVLLIVFSIFMYRSSACHPVDKTEFLLDTVCTMEIRNLPEEKGKELLDNAFSVCREYEHLLSRTRKGSDIYRISHAGGKEVTVSETTAEILAYADEISEETEGRFNIAIGRLSELWDFTSVHPAVPESERIKAALKTTDYRNIILNGNRVKLKDPGTRLDTGGIAKGYIAMKLAAYLEKNGVTEGLVNLGGDIAAIGDSGGKRPWNIGIEEPLSNRKKIAGSVKITDQAVFTSGTYERSFEQDGRTYHHILDPETGYPAETDLLSATIISARENAVYCDAYATTCILMGKSEGEKFMNEKDGYEYCFITKDNKIIKSRGFPMEEAI